MTKKDLASALNVSPSQITRYIQEKGMRWPISVDEARSWHDSEILDQGPRKDWASESDHSSKRAERPEPQWLKEEREEYLLAKQLATLDATGKNLGELRARYDKLASAVTQSHLELIEAAILRRFMSTETSPYEYVEAVAGLVAKWQKILSVECDESADAAEKQSESQEEA
jgi:hypothetical protein